MLRLFGNAPHAAQSRQSTLVCSSTYFTARTGGVLYVGGAARHFAVSLD
jgi:hypothetical protein